MALAHGWVPVPRLWFAQNIENHFAHTRSKQIRDFMVWIFQNAAIGDYKGMVRGQLRFSQRDAAATFKVSRATIQKWLKKLISAGFIYLDSRVARSKLDKTLVTVAGYPPAKLKKEQSSQTVKRSIIEERKEEDTKPLPLKRGAVSKSRFAKKMARYVMKNVMKRNGASAQEIASLTLGPKADALVRKTHGDYAKLCKGVERLYHKHRPWNVEAYASAWLARYMERAL